MGRDRGGRKAPDSELEGDWYRKRFPTGPGGAILKEDGAGKMRYTDALRTTEIQQIISEETERRYLGSERKRRKRE